jgi:hypothetical protein
LSQRDILVLSICRSIIEAHGGRLWATANLPHGAAFQFTLPVNADNASWDCAPSKEQEEARQRVQLWELRQFDDVPSLLSSKRPRTDQCTAANNPALDHVIGEQLPMRRGAGRVP